MKEMMDEFDETMAIVRHVDLLVGLNDRFHKQGEAGSKTIANWVCKQDLSKWSDEHDAIEVPFQFPDKERETLIVPVRNEKGILDLMMDMGADW